jgi:hypothetical protein
LHSSLIVSKVLITFDYRLNIANQLGQQTINTLFCIFHYIISALEILSLKSNGGILQKAPYSQKAAPSHLRTLLLHEASEENRKGVFECSQNGRCFTITHTI